MKIIFRATKELLTAAIHDLRRPHPFAYERVGWISVKAAAAGDDLLLLANEFHAVADDLYLKDPNIGAMLGQEALRQALNLALLNRVGMFHVHIHDHKGVPKFSPPDTREQSQFVPDFFAVQPKIPHGAIVFSQNAATGRTWLNSTTVRSISEFNSVGARSAFQMGSRFLGKRGIFV